MKVSKIFGFVLFLHLGVIGVLIVQPGCSTTQPPTQTYQQKSTLSGNPIRPTADGLIPATRVDSGLDAAFNAGFEDDRYAPQRPDNEFAEFDGIGALEPIPSIPTVDIAGPSYETYTVKKGDSLWGISKRYNVSVSELTAANGLDKNAMLKIGQQLQIPVEGSTAMVTTVTPDAYQPTAYNTGTQTYKVRAGDTLSKIAKKFDTTVNAIKALNSKSSDIIRVNEELLIPGTATSTPVPAASSGSSTPAPVLTSGSGDYRTHTVKSGEYPATIARKYGMTTNELLALNGITDPRKLQVGQKLKVSGSGSAANVDSKTETVVSPAPAPAPTPTPAPSSEPIAIRVIEADPLVEGEATELNVTTPAPAPAPTTDDADAMFEDAIEIPVIRMEE
ncbi:LysM peptidoglycan-binding domain-containing protein [Coraliomargarita parva]|uniref:LysM peptidoglycan-binding domain-containing protein n=1 Tax=Coraliomargarita parva TaxID=3014050 RepID=UPI0022B2BB81|nr:LysM peptidoglycan-binding domain-containing protein [Coraliomargarita parva]